MFTKGIKKRNIHHAGLFAISSNTTVLYIGMIDVQPGFPALVNIFQNETIINSPRAPKIIGNRARKVSKPSGQAVVCPFTLHTAAPTFNAGENAEYVFAKIYVDMSIR